MMNISIAKQYISAYKEFIDIHIFVGPPFSVPNEKLSLVFGKLTVVCTVPAIKRISSALNSGKSGYEKYTKKILLFITKLVYSKRVLNSSYLYLQ